MCATQVAVVEDADRSPFDALRKPTAWWVRLGARCSAPDCPHRGKLWPAWLRRAPGTFFEARWYCDPACMEGALEFRLRNLLSGFAAQKSKSHRIPLGLLLVERGVISSGQLREALQLQRESAGAGRIGDWLQQMGLVHEQQLAAALAQQWSCPLFPLDYRTAHHSWTSLVPLPLLDSSRAAPAHASPDGRVIHLAFGERIDHSLLYAVEHMLDCRTLACVAPEPRVAEFLTYWRRRVERTDINFGSIRDPREMTRIVGNYAAELRASRVVVARASAHVWVRFFTRQATRDLLFRIVSDGPRPAHLEKFSLPPKALPLSVDTRKDGVSDALGPL
ncbi:MAG TPA: hypothetical protein VFF58_00045 [Candidatus Nitrosotalea sp.]|nr:hypothetical protein [Candidatus Nitrosotalea sp.]